MFGKKVTIEEKERSREKLSELFSDVSEIDNIPVKEFMLKWLSAFAPDMSVYDAKSFCLPKLFYKNYLWHAFSFQKTDCYIEEDATEAYGDGFSGPCFVLLNRESILVRIGNGKEATLEKLKQFDNIIVFTEDFTETFVHTGNDEFGPYYKSHDMTISEDCEPEEIEMDELECEEIEE